MIVIQMDRTTLSDEQLTKVKADLLTYWTTTCDEKWSSADGDGDGHRLTGLMMQYNTGNAIITSVM
jgi:hypothetical protein